MPIPAIDMNRLPHHVAIIMDGNGRWAERHGLTHAEGHEAGAKSVRATTQACRKLGIQVLTLYAFSTENWLRPKAEVDALFALLSKYIRLELSNLHAQDIRITFMGRLAALSDRVRADLDYSMKHTCNNKAMIVNVALNYGGRAEIVDATRAIAAEVQSGKRMLDAVDEAAVASHLYMPDLPDPDLLIRTSGEMRLSNFMLWQLSYAEIVPLRVLWPDFRTRHLHQAIAQFQTRSRRFGGRTG